MAKYDRERDHLPGLLRAGPGFELAAVDPSSTPGFSGNKDDGAAALAAGVAQLSELQERLFASKGAGRSVLLIVQAMDTAGKGGIVRHVVGAVDPQGISHYGFKAPTAEERAHDVLWRIRKRLPAPGMIGVFDRSHYEDVLIVRVRELVAQAEWEARYETINAFEQEVRAAGTELVKVMLHISPAEQHARLSERLQRPDKYWKYNPGDLDERARWPQYMQAYQAAITRCAGAGASWHVVPANRKWYARLAVQQLLIDALERIDPQWPPADFDVAAEQARLAAMPVDL